MARHGFTDRPCRTVAEAAAHTVALQAQDLGQARLGVRSRSEHLVDADVTAAIAGRTVVRSWLMRNTIHLVDADDLRWLLRLFGPMIRRRFSKRWAELGLSPQLLARAAALTPEALSDGPRTRHEIVDALRRRGVELPPGQGTTHLMVYLATLGLTCHADGDRFALLEDWLPDAAPGPGEDEALAELARRYFRAYSPATAADFTAWSGLPSGRPIALIREELTPVLVHGRSGFRLGAQPDGGGVRLLGGFDNYLVGYRDRTGIITDDRRGAVYSGGLIRPTILRDGAVVGRWRLDRARGRVALEYFVAPGRRLRALVEAEVADLARFVGRPLEVLAQR